MEEQGTSPNDTDPRPVIAEMMGHELRALGFGAISRSALITWIAALPWGWLFKTPMAPETVASCVLVMFFHESGVSMSKLSGWMILMGILFASRPFFAWALTVVAPGAAPGV